MATSGFERDQFAAQRTLADVLEKLLLEAERSLASAFRVAEEMRIGEAARRIDEMDELTLDELVRLENWLRNELNTDDLFAIARARHIAERLIAKLTSEVDEHVSFASGWNDA
jgi:hypothetical protein